MQSQDLWTLLEDAGRSDPDRVYCTFKTREVSVSNLLAEANRVGDTLRNAGLQRGSRVVVMLPNCLEHVFLIFGLLNAGLIYVPVNVRAKGPGLEHIVKQVAPEMIIFDNSVSDTIRAAIHDNAWEEQLGVTQNPLSSSEMTVLRPLRTHERDEEDVDSAAARTDDGVVCISYTSGTTGPPKGVQVTGHMLLGCAKAVAHTIDARSGDTLLMWEPFYHVGGHQVLVLALIEPVKLAILPRFSASTFWADARRHRATQIHYLGGVLQILLRQPHDDSDRDHQVRIAWGAGAAPVAWNEFSARFGVELREVYGLTETSSINTVNSENRIGSMGIPLQEFAIEIVDHSGDLVPIGATGQIRMRSSGPGLFTPGYFRNPAGTAKLLPDDGWLYTGDAAHQDRDGFLYFDGRLTDNVRVGGENVSAWEVETVARAHPGVFDCAMIGASSELGEQDIKLFVQVATGATVTEQDLADWCAERLGSHQVPRYIEWISEFKRTPSMRIVKHGLSAETANCWDGSTYSRKEKV